MTYFSVISMALGKVLTDYIQQLRHYAHASLASISQWLDYLQRLRTISKKSEHFSTH